MTTDAKAVMTAQLAAALNDVAILLKDIEHLNDRILKRYNEPDNLLLAENTKLQAQLADVCRVLDQAVKANLGMVASIEAAEKVREALETSIRYWQIAEPLNSYNPTRDAAKEALQAYDNARGK